MTKTARQTVREASFRTQKPRTEGAPRLVCLAVKLTCDLDFERDGGGCKAAGGRCGGPAFDPPSCRGGALFLVGGRCRAERVHKVAAQAHLGADRAFLRREAFVICVGSHEGEGEDKAESKDQRRRKGCCPPEQMGLFHAVSSFMVFRFSILARSFALCQGFFADRIKFHKTDTFSFARAETDAEALGEGGV